MGSFIITKKQNGEWYEADVFFKNLLDSILRGKVREELIKLASTYKDGEKWGSTLLDLSKTENREFFAFYEQLQELLSRALVEGASSFEGSTDFFSDYLSSIERLIKQMSEAIKERDPEYYSKNIAPEKQK